MDKCEDVIFPINKIVKIVMEQDLVEHKTSKIRITLEENNSLTWNDCFGGCYDFEEWLIDEESSYYTIPFNKISKDNK